MIKKGLDIAAAVIVALGILIVSFPDGMTSMVRSFDRSFEPYLIFIPLFGGLISLILHILLSLKKIFLNKNKGMSYQLPLLLKGIFAAFIIFSCYAVIATHSTRRSGMSSLQIDQLNWGDVVYSGLAWVSFAAFLVMLHMERKNDKN